MSDAGRAGARERGRALSVVIPAYDEEGAIGEVLASLQSVLDGQDVDYEVIVVDDCSNDDTAAIAEAAGVRVLRNVQNGGYGFSLMRGIRAAHHPAVAIIDADGSYPVSRLPDLLAEYRSGIAMVVGHRQGEHYLSSPRIRLLRFLFRAIAQFIVGRSVPDVNSGMRIFHRETVLPLLPHMSFGFSFTTSITLLFMMQAHSVSYVPVEYLKRTGSSKVNYLRDSVRALQIIASITARLNPIKLFLLCSIVNVLVMLPVLLLFAIWGDVRVPIVIVLQTSALLVGLGFVVDGLTQRPASKRDHDAADGE